MCSGGDVSELRREMSQAGRVVRQWIGRLQNKDPHSLMETGEKRLAKSQRMVVSVTLQVSGPGGLQLAVRRPLGTAARSLVSTSRSRASKAGREPGPGVLGALPMLRGYGMKCGWDRLKPGAPSVPRRCRQRASRGAGSQPRAKAALAGQPLQRRRCAARTGCPRR